MSAQMGGRASLRDVMTPNPQTVRADSMVIDAAKAMADADVGMIPVITTEGEVSGAITDRDIAVRVVAQGLDPATCTVNEVATRDIITLSPDSPVAEAIEVMRSQALRRVPVVENNRVVGIVSIGDLAMEGESDSAVADTLADISAAPPND